MSKMVAPYTGPNSVDRELRFESDEITKCGKKIESM